MVFIPEEKFEHYLQLFSEACRKLQVNEQATQVLIQRLEAAARSDARSSQGHSKLTRQGSLLDVLKQQNMFESLLE